MSEKLERWCIYGIVSSRNKTDRTLKLGVLQVKEEYLTDIENVLKKYVLYNDFGNQNDLNVVVHDIFDEKSSAMAKYRTLLTIFTYFGECGNNFDKNSTNAHFTTEKNAFYAFFGSKVSENDCKNTFFEVKPSGVKVFHDSLEDLIRFISDEYFLGLCKIRELLDTGKEFYNENDEEDFANGLKIGKVNHN